MLREFHFGEVTLRDDVSSGAQDLDQTPAWSLDEVEAFRSPQKYVRGAGNGFHGVRLVLVSIHDSARDRAKFEREYFRYLWGSDFVTPRELWYIDLAQSPFPFSFGNSVARSIQTVGRGRSADGYILQTAYEFATDVLSLGDSGEVDNPPPWEPSLFVPNAYGFVLRREGDGAYVRITRDFTTHELVKTNLLGDPGTTHYEVVRGDVEWTDSTRGLGFYDTGLLLASLNRVTNEPRLEYVNGTSPDDAGYVYTYSYAKGLTFPDGYGPVLLTPDGRRLRLKIDSLMQEKFEEL